MKKTTLTTLLFLFAFAFAQAQFITLPADGGNKRAFVGEYIGINEIRVDYNRPSVKGREGKIWGSLVPFGFVNLGFGTAKESPWRAGANECTRISFSKDIKIEGKDLPAGTYGFFVVLDSAYNATLIFSKNATAWGSFFYTPEEDVLRVTVKAQKKETSVEFLQYAFYNQTEKSATLALEWEKLHIPMKLEVNVVEQVYASIQKELQTERGFTWQAWVRAVEYCLEYNCHLDQALLWADNAISGVYVGEENFKTLSTKSLVLQKLSKEKEAKEVMDKALSKGNLEEVHTYARMLLYKNMIDEAVNVFTLNAKKHPNHWMTKFGMMRAYSAKGKFKEALNECKEALKLVPDEENKRYLLQMKEKLERGMDINK